MALVLKSRRFTRMEVHRAWQGTASLPATPCAPRRRHVSTAQASHEPVVASMTITKGKTVATLTAANMNDFLQQHREKLVVVDYHTPLCGPCKFMGPVIEEMAQEFEDVVFAKFDCGTDSDSKQLALKAGIRALPTFQLYRHSPEGATQVLAELTGTKTKQLRHLVMHHRKDVSAQ